jgi:predicted metal-binding membrane protein
MTTHSEATATFAGQGGHTNPMAVAATTLVVTLGIATACWVLTIQRMSGMDMGVATRLGSFPYFLSVWVPMMAAMMLPGVAPALVRLAQRGVRVLAVPLYVGSYLAVWTLVGVAVFTVYRPHGTTEAGAIAVAAGIYELTPVKRRYREMCRRMVPSGLAMGLCCLASTIGLMLMMVALGAMSLGWMVLVAAVVLTQKLLAPRAAVDVTVAAAIVALGIVILVAPSAIPGLIPAMHTMPSM